MSVKVFGHLNPDTDSTCTPIVYADILTVKGKYGNDIQAVLLGEPNREALYLLDRFGIDKPDIYTGVAEGEKVVLIDTNNADELPATMDKAEILEIVDHHKLVGNLNTAKPIEITMRPLACAATIVFQLVENDTSVKLTLKQAGLLLGAIISDTLNFTSPTTTEEDKRAAEKLAEIARVKLDELAEEMFAAKSDLSGMSANDIILMDSKVFELAGKKVRVSVLETTDPSQSLALREELESVMTQMKKEEGLDLVFFYAVDILKTESTLIVPSETERKVAEKAYDVKFDGDKVLLPGVVSRKQQMVPVLDQALN